MITNDQNWPLCLQMLHRYLSHQPCREQEDSFTARRFRSENQLRFRVDLKLYLKKIGELSLNGGWESDNKNNMRLRGIAWHRVVACPGSESESASTRAGGNKRKLRPRRGF